MGRKKIPGLQFRHGVWHIDKIIKGKRFCESTGTGEIEEAERYLIRRLEEIRQAEVYGIRPKRTFMEAATEYLNTKEKASLADDAWNLERIMPFIGELYLENIHMGTLRPFIDHEKKRGLKARTINYPLQVVRHILNLAANEWMDEYGLTWLPRAPKIKLLPQKDARKPYPLSWEEQDRLFAELPEHLQNMCLFKINTGCREGEVCSLKWEWEIAVPKMGTSVFVIPGGYVKNRDERLVVLNDIARQVILRVRGQHPEHVFTFQGHPVKNINNTAWKKAKKRAGLNHIRVHDLKHTYGRRLRAGGVSYEDRQDLLGHKSGRITTHYSQAELENLITAANTACVDQSREFHEPVILRRKIPLKLVSNLAE